MKLTKHFFACWCRTAAGYRKSSSSFRQDMAVSSNATRRTLTATLQGHAFSVVDTPQDDEEKKIKKMVSNDAHRLARMERYAYVQHGNSQFQSTDILCVVADAVHVGSEDWLNVMLYNHTTDKVWVCPPQAGFFLPWIEQRPRYAQPGRRSAVWARFSVLFLDNLLTFLKQQVDYYSSLETTDNK